MCICNPSIKTPRCGGPGCEGPTVRTRVRQATAESDEAFLRLRRAVNALPAARIRDDSEDAVDDAEDALRNWTRVA